MTGKAPILWWVRRDLRLADNPALHAACEGGGPVIPVFVCDPLVDGLGAAPRWRLEQGLRVLGRTLADAGSRLILRRGPARETLLALASETGARSVNWGRLVDPDARERDTDVKAGLKQAGLDARSFAGHLLFEPWTVETGSGGFYRVYTPYWKAVRNREVAAPADAPALVPAPDRWPSSDDLDDWHLGAGMRRGAPIVAHHTQVGSDAARDRLARFTKGALAEYDTARDLPGVDGTSRLSAHLALGEISPARCWHAARFALERGVAGAETFLKELVWRDFAHHLAYHTPRLTRGNWREDWDGFAWNTDPSRPEVQAWIQGRTGMEFVDASLREMYVTGTMHNRGRMIVASYLTKHLMTHWKIGLDWFADCLTDWDPASNAMGWQWSAGSGPDATPYFRVFNPETQADKFDRDGAYRRRWIAEGHARPSDTALSYFEAIPRSWGLSPADPYPKPVVDARSGRHRALDAYAARGF